MTEFHIIGEAGTNHGGDLDTAKKLVDIAREARADSVKFQIIYPEGLYLRDLLIDGEHQPNEVFEKRRQMMLTDDEYRELAVHARERDIPFSASIFDERGIDLLDELDVRYFKLASCDLNNSRLLTVAAERGRKMIVSTGMASLAEVEEAVEAIVRTGNDDLVLLHCVSIYPCPVNKMNLSFIDTLQTAFGFPVGLSDHTESSLAAAVAVSKGVRWFEKHFTMDRTLDGFDHSYAMEPDGLAGYIRDIHDVGVACSRSAEKVTDTEGGVKLRARRGVYAARDMAAGEVLTWDDVLIVRPESDLAPNDAQLVVGRALKQSVTRNEGLSLDHVCSNAPA